MKNNYKIVKDIVYIELNRRDGTKLYSMIDVIDLEKLKDINVKWYALYEEGIKSFYCVAHIKINNKKRMLSLHRVLLDLDFGDKLMVDHINHEGLDNTRKKYKSRNQSRKSIQ